MYLNKILPVRALQVRNACGCPKTPILQSTVRCLRYRIIFAATTHTHSEQDKVTEASDSVLLEATEAC